MYLKESRNLNIYMIILDQDESSRSRTFTSAEFSRMENWGLIADLFIKGMYLTDFTGYRIRFSSCKDRSN